MPGWAAVLLLLATPLALADPDDATDSSDAGPARSTFHIKSTTVARITGPIKVDGRLDEAAWAQATVISDFEQIQPGNGTPPSEPTEFRVAIDGEYLYIGARLRDSDPAGIKRTQLVQGAMVTNDDHVQVLLDTYNNRRTGYVFYLNPNGVLRDGLLLGGMSYNMDWDGIWEGQAQVGDDGWTAEIALPFKTLSFDPDNDTWSLNLVRAIRRKGEQVAWAQNDRRITLDVNGELHGMQGLDQGLGLD